jgi:hypothetical protein
MRAVQVTSGTTGVTAVTGGGALVGFSMRTTVGSASTATVIRDGVTNAGAILAYADTSTTNAVTFTPIPAIPFTTGLFVDRTTATSEMVIYVV